MRQLRIAANKQIEITPDEDVSITISDGPVDIDDSVRHAQLRKGQTYRFQTSTETVMSYRARGAKDLVLEKARQVSESKKPDSTDP